MSVDHSAHCVYGWRLDFEELPEQYRKLYGDGECTESRTRFIELVEGLEDSGKFVRENKWISVANSWYYIGYPIAAKDVFMNETVAANRAKSAYKELFGKYPNTPPTAYIFVETW